MCVDRARNADISRNDKAKNGMHTWMKKRLMGIVPPIDKIAMYCKPLEAEGEKI